MTSKTLGHCVIYAIDIGGTKMKSGVHTAGETVAKEILPTPRATKDTNGEKSLFEAIRLMVDRLQTTCPPMDALAVSVTGIMTFQAKPNARNYGPFRDRELYVLAPNVDGLKYVPIMERLESLGWGVPIHVENDVNAALESATDVEEGICIFLGDGLGAGIKRHGRVEHVAGTWSCYEIGHGVQSNLPEELTRRCHCGNNGCLESAIGGWAMRERYGVTAENASPEIYDAMCNDVIEWLSPAIANLIEQSGIRRVVLAGKGFVGYVSRRDDFIERLRHRAEELAPGAPVDVTLAELGEMAELHGAVLALKTHHVLDGLSCDVTRS